MKFISGDKVKIRDNIISGQSYVSEGGSPIYVNHQMEDLAGEIVTIQSICRECYKIKEDGGRWFWSIGMFDLSYIEHNEQAKFDENEWLQLMCGE